MGKAQLGKRDPRLGRPAGRVRRRGRVPHGIELALAPLVLGVARVSVVRADPRRGNREAHARAPVHLRVQRDREPLRVPLAVTPGHGARDRPGIAPVHPRPYVERLVVVENEDLGPLGGRFALDRTCLDEVLDRLRRLPDGVVEAAVDPRRTRLDAHSGGDFRGWLARQVRGGSKRGQGDRQRGNRAVRNWQTRTRRSGFGENRAPTPKIRRSRALRSELGGVPVRAPRATGKGLPSRPRAVPTGARHRPIDARTRHPESLPAPWGVECVRRGAISESPAYWGWCSP
jgi:hypothetical protein